MRLAKDAYLKGEGPDINPKTDPNVNKECPPSPTVKRNPHFYFHFLAPAGLSLLIVLALTINFWRDGNP